MEYEFGRNYLKLLSGTTRTVCMRVCADNERCRNTSQHAPDLVLRRASLQICVSSSPNGGSAMDACSMDHERPGLVSGQATTILVYTAGDVHETLDIVIHFSAQGPHMVRLEPRMVRYFVGFTGHRNSSRVGVLSCLRGHACADNVSFHDMFRLRKYGGGRGGIEGREGGVAFSVGPCW